MVLSCLTGGLWRASGTSRNWKEAVRLPCYPILGLQGPRDNAGVHQVLVSGSWCKATLHSSLELRGCHTRSSLPVRGAFDGAPSLPPNGYATGTPNLLSALLLPHVLFSPCHLPVSQFPLAGDLCVPSHISVYLTPCPSPPMTTSSSWKTSKLLCAFGITA
jgi:hypothetical protein